MAEPVRVPPPVPASSPWSSPRPKPYADRGSRRVAQVLGDLLVVGWIVLWIWAGVQVHDATLALAEPGERAAASAAGLSSSFEDAGGFLGQVPLVGDGVRAPFEKAAAASDQLAAAGTTQAQAARRLAWWLGVVVAAVPSLYVLARWLPGRWRYAREAGAGAQLLAGGPHLELFAWRALAQAPLSRLTALGPDPAGALRDGDPEMVRRLAALELERWGLAVPAVSGERGRAAGVAP